MCNIYPIWKMDHAQNLFFNWCYHSHGMHGSNLTKKNDFLHLWSLGRWVFKNLNFLLVVQTSVVDFPHDFATWLDCLHICSSSNCMEHFPFDLASLCYCTPSSSHLMFLCSSFFVRLVMLISLDICVFPFVIMFMFFLVLIVFISYPFDFTTIFVVKIHIVIHVHDFCCVVSDYTHVHYVNVCIKKKIQIMVFKFISNPFTIFFK